jgi:two-component system, cell cycle sensor histidine kinase and response regulator CckA
VRGHGGALTVQSEIGKGSVFSVYLPVLTAVSQSNSETTLKALPRSSHKLEVWVVDDEPDVAHTTLHMLRALGHETRAFGSAKAALEAFATEGTNVSLCVLDRVMPEQSGDELLRQLRLIRPGLPAVFVSGYSEDHNDASTPLDNAVFVQKPFGPKDLYRALATLMPNA